MIPLRRDFFSNLLSGMKGIVSSGMKFGIILRPLIPFHDYEAEIIFP